MSDPKITAATGALRQEASVWDGNADRLRLLLTKVDALRVNYLSAGMFAILVDAYSDLIDVVSGRCREGAQSATDIATALRRVADVYDAEEAANLHAVMNLH